jgi:PadR family transcriptional regulator, regulatory protein PadR
MSAAGAGKPKHGWAIKKDTGLSGATTYKILDRLEDAGWITWHWGDLGYLSGFPAVLRRPSHRDAR